MKRLFPLRTKFVPPVVGHVLRPCVPVRSASDYESHVSGKYMQKFLNKRGAKAKKKWYQPHLAEPLEPIGMKSGPQKSSVSEVQRTRARQLSHVLYSKITHIIGTGELSQEILDKQVFISEVKMHANFAGVNVYWDADRNDSKEVEQLLTRHSGKLRSLLISYHVLGKIPPICFVKDKGRLALEDLDKLLAEADYGEDYEISSSVVKAKRRALGLDPDPVEVRSTSAPSAQEPTPVPSSGSCNEDVHNSKQFFSQHRLSDEEGIDSSDVDTHRLSSELNFRNNMYGLPVDVLVKKITAKKNKVWLGRESGADSGLEFASEDDRAKKLATLAKMNLKPKHFKESNKMKHRMLERDPMDFRGMSGHETESQDDYSVLEEEEEYDMEVEVEPEDNNHHR